MKVKRTGRNLVIFEDKPINNHINERSRPELSFDMVIHKGIFENNQITVFPYYTLIPKTGGSFYCLEAYALST